MPERPEIEIIAQIPVPAVPSDPAANSPSCVQWKQYKMETSHKEFILSFLFTTAGALAAEHWSTLEDGLIKISLYSGVTSFD